MTEAAKLYWKDIDVLEEARWELVEFFDSVWSQTLERIISLADDSEFKIDHYQDRQRPGRYTVNIIQGQPAKFDIRIDDPRRSDDSKYYNVKIQCYQAQKSKIDKLTKDARASITSIASSHGIDILWDRPKNVLCKTNIEVTSDDAELVVDRLFEVIEKMIGWITESYNWMIGQKK
jgi:hypothetical protein